MEMPKLMIQMETREGPPWIISFRADGTAAFPGDAALHEANHDDDILGYVKQMPDMEMLDALKSWHFERLDLLLGCLHGLPRCSVVRRIQMLDAKHGSVLLTEAST